MPAAAIGGILWKKVFFKILQYLQETLVPEKTPATFATFLRTHFLQGNCLWNAAIAKAKRDKHIAFVAERWMQCLLLRLKPQSTREASRYSTFMGICPTNSHRWGESKTFFCHSTGLRASSQTYREQGGAIVCVECL